MGREHKCITINKGSNSTEIAFNVYLDSCCACAYHCSDVVFNVDDKYGNKVAEITKYWGKGKDTCTGNFRVFHKKNSYLGPLMLAHFPHLGFFEEKKITAGPFIP